MSIDSNLFSLADIEPDHLRACLCYVENAIGSAKSDLSEDSIERFSCFARLKIKYKSLGTCFARLQFCLYRLKTSAIQGRAMEIDELFYRSKTFSSLSLSLQRTSIVLWISSLYYFLSDSQDDALACIYQLMHLFPDAQSIILPNLFNHTTISRSISSFFCLKKSSFLSVIQIQSNLCIYV